MVTIVVLFTALATGDVFFLRLRFNSGCIACIATTIPPITPPQIIQSLVKIASPQVAPPREDGKQLQLRSAHHITRSPQVSVTIPFNVSTPRQTLTSPLSIAPRPTCVRQRRRLWGHAVSVVVHRPKHYWDRADPYTYRFDVSTFILLEIDIWQLVDQTGWRWHGA